MKDKSHVVLDVRTRQEKELDSIPNAQHIDYYTTSFEEQLKLLDKSKAYLVYCRNGGRGRKSCAMMANLGFEKLYNLKGGIKAWNNSKK